MEELRIIKQKTLVIFIAAILLFLFGFIGLNTYGDGFAWFDMKSCTSIEELKTVFTLSNMAVFGFCLLFIAVMMHVSTLIAEYTGYITSYWYLGIGALIITFIVFCAVLLTSYKHYQICQSELNDARVNAIIDSLQQKPNTNTSDENKDIIIPEGWTFVTMLEDGVSYVLEDANGNIALKTRGKTTIAEAAEMYEKYLEEQQKEEIPIPDVPAGMTFVRWNEDGLSYVVKDVQGNEFVIMIEPAVSE